MKQKQKLIKTSIDLLSSLLLSIGIGVGIAGALLFIVNGFFLIPELLTLSPRYYRFSVNFMILSDEPGLEIDLGSDVYYDGTPVGKVVGIETEVYEKDREIEVEIEIPKQFIINKQSNVFIETISIGGASLVHIKPIVTNEFISEAIKAVGPLGQDCEPTYIICDGDVLKGYKENDSLNISRINIGRIGRNEFCNTQFWVDNPNKWVQIFPEDDFDTTFNVDLYDPDITLLEAVKGGRRIKDKIAKISTLLTLSSVNPNIDSRFNCFQSAFDFLQSDQILETFGEIDFFILEENLLLMQKMLYGQGEKSKEKDLNSRFLIFLDKDLSTITLADYEEDKFYEILRYIFIKSFQPELLRFTTTFDNRDIEEFVAALVNEWEIFMDGPSIDNIVHNSTIFSEMHLEFNEVQRYLERLRCPLEEIN